MLPVFLFPVNKDYQQHINRNVDVVCLRRRSTAVLLQLWTRASTATHPPAVAVVNCIINQSMRRAADATTN